MIVRHQKNVDPGVSENEKKSGEPQEGAGNNGTCRCKEASEMTPRELLRLMMGDLAFWKKEKKV